MAAAAREDDSPADEPLRVAALADRLGHRRVRAGGGPAWDAFVLAAALGRVTDRPVLTAGPVRVSVRDPYTLVRGRRVGSRRHPWSAGGRGGAVGRAETGADRAEVVRALPPAAAATVGPVGPLGAVRSRIDAHAEAGLDEIALVPATAADPAGSGR
ncbi:hypothetical protein [Streptomyces sp. NPDC005476]|uniref:hypothetical protein n=1 Tax=Streptomyces sp. NPDC005476 TaxID=3156882 RepID=UPI003452D61D